MKLIFSLTHVWPHLVAVWVNERPLRPRPSEGPDRHLTSSSLRDENDVAAAESEGFLSMAWRLREGGLLSRQSLK